MTTPRLVAVDLTPLLPGGENGGAKVFVLDLVRRLARLAPETRFVLLTQHASHGELALLDAPNVRRLMVIGPAAASWRSRVFALAAPLLRAMPALVRAAAARAGYALHGLLKRGGARGPVAELGADVLFCPFTAPTFRVEGVRTVCTLYDLQFRAYPGFFAVEDRVQRERAFMDACRHADALAAISEFTRSAAIEAAGVDPARIRAIALRIARRPEPGAEGPGESGPYLLYPANFWRHKNHELLLTAFGIACRTGLAPEVRLLCTGAPGARRDALMAAARRMGLGERVGFPGFVSEARLTALLRGATGVVFPSLYEGFGIPVVEAMAAGVPVACSNTTALPEVAGDAALLFDPRLPAEVAGAIVSLAGDAQLRARLVAAGAARAVTFSDGDHMAREYLELLAA